MQLYYVATQIIQAAPWVLGACGLCLVAGAVWTIRRWRKRAS